MGALRGRLLLVALALLLGVALYGILGAATGLIPSEEDATLVGSLEEKAPHEEVSWPPEAWRAGDLQALSLHELAYLIAGTSPTTTSATTIDEQLQLLDELPASYTHVAHRSLLGLAEATWHQQQAQAPLTPEQRSLLTDLEPNQPLTPEAHEALDKLDHDHVALAASALTTAASDIELILDRPAPPTSVGDALRDALTQESNQEAPPPILQGSADPDQLATLIDTLTHEPLESTEQAAIAHELSDAPDPARRALHQILSALTPFAQGAPADEKQALIQLGDAIDAARPTLEAWAAQANAARYVDATTLTPEELDVPDPNAEVPPLRIAHAAGSTPPEAPANLTVALRDLALAFNDSTTAANANTHVEPLQALPQHQQETLATTFAAMTAYLEALEAVPVEQTPADVLENPGTIEAWASMLDEGELVSPNTEEAQRLLDAQPYLDAVVDVLDARGGLLEAVEELVPGFTQPASASGSSDPLDPCQVDPDLDRVQIAFYLQADFCGVDQTWDMPAMLTLDTGGDNVHTHRAAAPFNATEQAEDATGSTITLGGQELWVPISLTLDLGGSTEYRPTDTETCTLGSACVPGDETPCNPGAPCPPAGGESRAEGSIAILVDWTGDATDTENVFDGGDQSQASSSVGLSYGLVVERAGKDASIASTYEAGDQSMASLEVDPVRLLDFSGGSDTNEGLSEVHPHRLFGTATLVRLVGDQSTSQAAFRSGTASQGSSLGIFLNLAGDGATTEHEYQSGDQSQGSIGLFMDVAGEDSRTENLYAAGDRSQGWFGGVFVSGAGQGSVSNDRFEMPDGTEGRGARGYFVSAVAPGTKEPDGAVESRDGALIFNPSGDIGEANNDDVYVGAHRGYGSRPPAPHFNHETVARGTFFLDLGGNDTYPEHAGPEGEIPTLEDADPEGEILTLGHGPCNNCAWFWGLDSSFGDADHDAFPDFVNALWPGGALWEADADDEDESPSPTPARALVELDVLEPTNMTIDQSYAFILTLGGDNRYTENASAGLLFDLGGDDRYEGHIGAASFELPQRTLSFALDLSGDDAYIAPTLNKTQGYADGGGSGLLFNLAGDNTYWANSHAQGAANGTILMEEAPEDADEELPEALNPEGTTLPGLGVLLDGTDPEEDELNLFRVRESPSQGEGQNGGTGILIAAGEDNRFASGGQTIQEAVDEQDPPDLAREFFEDVDEECEREGEWPSPGARCSERAGERIEMEHDGYGLRVNLGEPASSDALQDFTLAFAADGDEDQAGQGGPPTFGLGETVSFEAEVIHRDGDDVTFDWAFPQAKGENRSETVTQLGDHDGEQSFNLTMEHAWTHVDAIQVLTQPDGDVSGEAHQDFTVSVTATDPRGAQAATEATVRIEHDPLPLLHLHELPGNAITEPTLLLGPTDIELDDEEGPSRFAYQLPVNDTRGQDRVLTRATWPGGGNASHEVNWSRPAHWSTTPPAVSLPEAATGLLPSATVFPDEEHEALLDERGQSILTGAPRDCLLSGRLADMLDGNRSTGPLFQLAGVDDFCPPVHFMVSLPEPRQIHEVTMNIDVDGLLSGTAFTVHGVAPNGSIQRLGTLGFDEGAQQTRNVPVPFGVYDSFLVRQEVPHRLDVLQPTITVRSFEARGPGVIATPPAGEAVPLHVGIVDDAGAVNKTTVNLHVDPGLVELDEGLGAGHPLVRFEGIATRGAPHHTSLVTDNAYNLTLSPSEAALQLGENLCIRFTQDDAEGELACTTWDNEDPDTQPESLNASLEWGDPGVRTVYWELTGGQLAEADRTIVQTLTTAHVEPGFDLVSNNDPLLLVLLGDEETPPLDTWHYADRDRGVPNYLALVDGGGDDRYIGDHAVSRPLQPSEDTPQASTNLGARPGLVVDTTGNDDYLSTRSFTQGYGYFGAVGVLWDAGGDDRYVASSHAQGAAYKQGLGLLIDRGGSDAYNPVPASHPALIDYSPMVPDPVHGLGKRGDMLANTTRAMGAMPDAEFVQGAGDEGVGLLMDTGGHDLFAAGHRAQGYGQHGANKTEAYAFPGDVDACGPPVGTSQGGNINQNPQAALCWMGILIQPFDPRQWGDGPLGNPQPDEVSTDTLTSFVQEGPRYGPGAGALVKTNGSATYHALGQAQGSSGPDGRGALIDTDGAFTASLLRQGQGFSDGGQAGLFAGGEHTVWIDGQGQGFSRPSDEHPEHPSQAPVDRPENHAAVYARAGGESTCASENEDGECGVPVDAGEADDASSILNPSWNTDDSDVDPSAHERGNHESWTGSQLHLSVQFTPSTEAEELEVEIAAFTQPWANWNQDGCQRTTANARPLSPPVRVQDTISTTDPAGADLTLALAETIQGQPVFPAGCHMFTVFTRAVDPSDGTRTPWERLEGQATLLPPPEIRLYAQEALDIVTNLEDQALTIDLASGQPLPLFGPSLGPSLDTRFEIVDQDSDSGLGIDLGTHSLTAPGGPEAFHVTSEDVQHGFVRQGALCGEMDVTFRNIPDEAASIAYFLFRNTPDAPSPPVLASSWNLGIPPDATDVQETLPAPCPGTPPARTDQAHLLQAYALDTPVNTALTEDLDPMEAQRALLHGIVLAQASLPMTASPDPLPFDWGPLGDAVGVREQLAWENLLETFEEEGVGPAALDGKTFDIKATARWGGPGIVASPVELGSLTVDMGNKPTSISLHPSPVQADGTAHWKRTAPIAIQGQIQVDETGQSALPEKLEVRSVFLDDHQGSHVIDEGEPMASAETKWVLVEEEQDLALRVLDEHAGSPIHLRLTDAEDAAGQTTYIIEWEIPSTEILPSTDAFLGGLSQIQARVTDEAGNTPEWEDPETATGTVFFDGVAPTVKQLEAPGGSSATNDTFPINLTARLEDGASGVNASRAEAYMLDQDQRLHPLELATDPDDAKTVDFAFRWDGHEGPDEGRYEVVLEGHDRVGNHLLVLPGIHVTVDRTPPNLEGINARIVGDEAWIGNHTPVEVSLDVEDPEHNNVTSGIDHVVATVEGDQASTSLQLHRPHEDDPEYNRTLTIPPGLASQPTELAVNITACDTAGNCAFLSSDAFPYFPAPPRIVQDEVRQRGESIAYDVRTDRPTSVDEEATFLEDPTTAAKRRAEVGTSGLNHTLVFAGLRPDTGYEGHVVLHDEAGYTVIQSISLATVGEIQGTSVALDPLPGTLSGTVHLTGSVTQSTGGDLSLHVVDVPDEERLQEALRTQGLGPALHEIAIPRGTTQTFAFDVDTQQPPWDPETEQTVTFVTVFDDEANRWNASTPVRIDNAPPRIAPLVQGPTPTNGWYNGPLIVDANAHDATGPITYEASLNDASPEERRTLLIRENGVHNVAFHAHDAVSPPNNATHTMTLRIDRTTPHLNASVNLSSPASHRPIVPLLVEADEARSGPSGLDGFRTNTNGTWTPWTSTPPEQLVLEDAQEGERWVEVQLRDRAGNTAQATLTFVLDRTAPELLEARWRDGNQSHRDLEVVAADRMEGPGLPAGVEGIRWAAGVDGSWTGWQRIEDSTWLSIPRQALEGEGMVRLQVRDLAGNVGGVHVLRVGESLERAGSMDTESSSRPTPDVFARPMVTPSHGTQETRFTFSIGVFPWDGQAPTRVWVTVGDQEIDLEQVGLLDDGARLYSATSRLDAVDMEEEPSYRFHAAFPAGTVSTSLEPAPFVTGAPGGVSEGGGLLQGVPTVRAGIVLVAVVLCALAVWRFQGGRDA